jgi:hypothetical protein
MTDKNIPIAKSPGRLVKFGDPIPTLTNLSLSDADVEEADEAKGAAMGVSSDMPSAAPAAEEAEAKGEEAGVSKDMHTSSSEAKEAAAKGEEVGVSKDMHASTPAVEKVVADGAAVGVSSDMPSTTPAAEDNSADSAPKRKLLSGAEKRRRARARKAAAAEAAGGTAKADGAPQKRPREPSEAAESAKKPKEADGSGQTYSAAARSALTIAVAIDVGTDEQQAAMTEEDTEHVVSNLLDYMDDDSEQQPQFGGSYLQNGRWVTTCEDTATLAWMRRAVAQLPSRDVQGGASIRYRLVEPEEMRKTRAYVFIAKRKGQDRLPLTDEIMKRIKRQNKLLKVDDWTVFHRTNHESGVSLVLGIDQQSTTVLRNSNCKFAFEFTKVTMTFTEAARQ